MLMPEFEQSAASRQALHDAAVSHLRSPRVVSVLAGTSDKKSKAYKNAQRRVQLATAPATAKQRRPLGPKLLAQVAGNKTLRVSIKADFAAGDDPAYLREGKDMPSGGPGVPVDAAAFLALALSDPDEAYQMFFEEYVLPPGTVENVQSISFK